MEIPDGIPLDGARPAFEKVRSRLECVRPLLLETDYFEIIDTVIIVTAKPDWENTWKALSDTASTV